MDFWGRTSPARAICITWSTSTEIEQEADLRPLLVHGIQRGPNLALVGDVSLGRHGCGRYPQAILDQNSMQQDHVKFTLRRRYAGHELGQVGVMPQAQQRKNAVGIHSECPSALSACQQIAMESLVGHGASNVAAKRIIFLLEYRRNLPAERVEIERRQIRHQPVRRQDQQSFATRIKKRHHGLFVRSVSPGALGGRAAFIAVGEGCFVAVVAIRDDQFLRSHGLHHAGDCSLIEYRPDAVHHAIFVPGLIRTRPRRHLIEHGVDPPLRVGIKHKKLSRMGESVAQKFEPIDFRPGQRLLMPKDDAGGIVLDAPKSDKSLARLSFRCSLGPRIPGSRHKCRD